MSITFVTMIGVLANLTFTIFKEIRRSQCAMGWGCCSCATVSHQQQSTPQNEKNNREKESPRIGPLGGAILSHEPEDLTMTVVRETVPMEEYHHHPVPTSMRAPSPRTPHTPHEVLEPEIKMIEYHHRIPSPSPRAPSPINRTNAFSPQHNSLMVNQPPPPRIPSPRAPIPPDYPAPRVPTPRTGGDGKLHPRPSPLQILDPLPKANLTTSRSYPDLPPTPKTS